MRIYDRNEECQCLTVQKSGNTGIVTRSGCFGQQTGVSLWKSVKIAAKVVVGEEYNRPWLRREYRGDGFKVGNANRYALFAGK